MTGFSVIVATLVFVGFLLLSSRFFCFVEMKSVAVRITKSLGLNIVDLDYSFEQIVYFVSLPSNIPTLKNAKQEDLVIKLDYRSLFFPRLTGIKIFIKTEEENIIISYLPTKDFRLPVLDQILEQGKINRDDYLKISTYKLIHQTTLNEIAEESYKQIRLGRNGKTVSEEA
ncbi:hypothetical protein SAMN04488542_11391 [Fontibacillus panacisegetis]|uniref:Uncharacterized protein n=1 Tax=Fontibacillus panacisegetis TaxID=670482 RepID=A0A1G7MET9_9BACL|nr:hypothetical protein [Fontibacillus panacisegetis]SDF60247.1 hypothetical protein SAMN04488542_11391 [Fontibacillus panacisegetis]